MALRTNIPWEQYVRDCGFEAQQANEARTVKAFREKYQGKVAEWSGTVQSITEIAAESFALKVVMNPGDHERREADVCANAGREFEEKLLALNRGDKIRFAVKITSQGGYFLEHGGDLVRLEKEL